MKTLGKINDYNIKCEIRNNPAMEKREKRERSEDGGKGGSGNVGGGHRQARWGELEAIAPTYRVRSEPSAGDCLAMKLEIQNGWRLSDFCNYNAGQNQTRQFAALVSRRQIIPSQVRLPGGFCDRC